MMRHPELTQNVRLPIQPGYDGRLMLAILNEQKLRRVLAKMLDDTNLICECDRCDPPAFGIPLHKLSITQKSAELWQVLGFGS